MPANCGVASVIRATQVSPLRCGVLVRGVATVFRATQVSPLRLAAASCGVATVVRAVMDVGAPFMTPGAGTARPVRGVVRGSVRDVSGQLRRCDGCSRGVSGQLRRCDGCSGDTSVAPTFGGGIPRRCDGYSRGDGRRGAIYDARCRNGTTRPRRCSRRCTRCFRPIAALRRLSGRHKCRPYVWRRHPAALRRLFGR